MTTPTCTDEATRSLVGFLVLGRLSAEEHATVTAHLASCVSCRIERDNVDSVVALLGRLSVADIRELAAEFGTPDTGPPDAADQLFGAPGAPRRRVAPDRPAPPPMPAPRVVRAAGEVEGYLPPRPATGPLARGPHTHRKATAPRRRRGRTVALSGLGVVVIALAVVLVARPWQPLDHGRPVVVAVAAIRDTSGVDLSATLYEEDGRVSARITADGLSPGAYQLVAGVGRDQEIPIAWLTGAPGGNTFTGDVPVVVADLRYFRLRSVDGDVVVSAVVKPGSPAPG